jgi:hypothetical protein
VLAVLAVLLVGSVIAWQYPHYRRNQEIRKQWRAYGQEDALVNMDLLPRPTTLARITFLAGIIASLGTAASTIVDLRFGCHKP